MGWEIRQGDVIGRMAEMPDESIHCCVTSPPYFGLRDYGVAGQIGLESTPDEFIAKLVTVFREVRRVLRSDGTLWLNIGDSYAGSWGAQSREHAGKHAPNVSALSANQVKAAQIRTMTGALGRTPGCKAKDLIGIPWMLAFALRADGWYLRSDIIWAKPNGMPESVLDRPARSHEYLFMLTKSARYWSDFDAVKTPPRESSMVRLAQDVQAHAGSHRANGGAKSNGAMKAVQATDKQRGHSRRHDGFNERWDAMGKPEQQAMPANLRDVWFIAPANFDEAHFATMPEEMARRCILAGCPESGTVLDPFSGSGTTGMVALRHGRSYIGLELNAEYVAMSERRIYDDAPLLNGTVL